MTFRAFEEGDVVYLYAPGREARRSRELSRLWKEPFVVQRVYDAVDAKIRPIGGGLAQRVQMDRLIDRSHAIAVRRRCREQNHDDNKGTR